MTLSNEFYLILADMQTDELSLLKEGNPYFTHKGKRYHLGNVNTTCPIILRCRNNMWSAFNNDELPSHIHGYSSESYNPIFVEISDCGDSVRVYERTVD